MKVDLCVYVRCFALGVLIYAPVADYRVNHEGLLRKGTLDDQADLVSRCARRDNPRER